MMSKDLYTSPNAIMLDFWVFGVSESQPWVLSRYEKLWSAFGDRRFTRDEALKVLRELEGDAFSEESLN
jgi:hypothetical protein